MGCGFGGSQAKEYRETDIKPREWGVKHQDNNPPCSGVWFFSIYLTENFLEQWSPKRMPDTMENPNPIKSAPQVPYPQSITDQKY